MRVLTHTVTAAEDGLTVRLLLAACGHIDRQLSQSPEIPPGYHPQWRTHHRPRPWPTPAICCAADISDPPGEHPHIQPVDFPLDILYEDDDPAASG